jgi:hypothetical protein
MGAKCLKVKPLPGHSASKDAWYIDMAVVSKTHGKKISPYAKGGTSTVVALVLAMQN